MSDTWQWKWSQAKLRATSPAHPSAIAGYTELVRVGGNALGAAAALPCGPRATVGPQIGSPSEFATSEVTDMILTVRASLLVDQ